MRTRSFDETQARWTPMEKEAHGYEGAVWAERYAKGFKKFLVTDHKNNTFRCKVTPSRRITKKLLKSANKI